jgi:hypothetical protein
MNNINPTKTSTQTLERALSSTAAAVCVIECLWVGQALSHQQPIWPLPALYLIEIGIVSLICWLSVLYRGAKPSSFSASVAWAAIGLLTAFVVMGLWSIGLLFVPVTALFIITAILVDHRQNSPIFLHLGVGALAALAQVALMLFVIRII